jgi:hypothetical protein
MMCAYFVERKGVMTIGKRKDWQVARDEQPMIPDRKVKSIHGSIGQLMSKGLTRNEAERQVIYNRTRRER